MRMILSVLGLMLTLALLGWVAKRQSRGLTTVAAPALAAVESASEADCQTA